MANLMASTFEEWAELTHFCQLSPIVPGHEIVGHVAAVGDGESVWKVGDRIGGAWHGGHDGEL